MRQKLVTGNWKMNTIRESAEALARGVADVGRVEGVDILLAPPFPYLLPVADAVRGTGIRVAGQNAWHEPPGAYTGEVALAMLVDCGCSAVILGHSERRHVLLETDAIINCKVRAAVDAGLQVVLCVGELLAEREVGKTETVLNTQMAGGLAGVEADEFANVVVAYEPVWAIGTGRTATPDQAQAAHAHLRNWIAGRYNPEIAEATRILYGGSVKPGNAAELMNQPDVDGALVGGASLNADDFVAIIKAAASTDG